jgi:monovalent cation:H+ antiporter, CPA1 family
MAQFVNTEILIIGLLLIASLVAIAVRRLQIPYSVALVIAGLLLTIQPWAKFELTPELILTLFVPPLIFEAAFHLNFKDLRRSLPAILVLAVPGVILTMFIVGGALVVGVHLSLPVALVFGALISATDPVAVVSLFRLLGVPKPLAVLVEGESMFNDGTALVLFGLALASAVTGQFNFLQSLGDFIRVSIGGIAVGLGLGWLVSRLIAQVDDYLIETTLTTVLAFGAYLAADQLHFSGVLAVVAAGLVNGNLGKQGMSPTTRIVLFNFWEYLAFLTNSLVFILIGLQVNIPSLISAWQPILWAIAGVIVARLLVVYPLSWISNRFGEPVSFRWQHVLTWGGLRGALSLALALSLPVTFGPDRSLLLEMAFGVVLFSLLVQATTMRSLVHRLGIITRSPAQIEYEMRQAELTASRAAEAHMERRYREGLISAQAWEKLKPRLQDQNVELARAVRAVLKSEPSLESEELDLAQREILRARRSAYTGLRRDGVISEEVYSALVSQVDADLEPRHEEMVEPAQEASTAAEGGDGGIQLELKELIVESGSACEGNRVRHIAWPDAFVIAGVKRGGQTLAARGETVLQAGDVLVTMADEKAFREAQVLCRSGSYPLK